MQIPSLLSARLTRQVLPQLLPLPRAAPRLYTRVRNPETAAPPATYESASKPQAAQAPRLKALQLPESCLGSGPHSAWEAVRLILPP